MAQKEDLGIDLSAAAYVAVNCEIVESESTALSAEKLLSLCAGTVRMVRETLKKMHKCYITTMDIRHFSIAFCFKSGDIENQCAILRSLLLKTVSLVRNYYNVNLRAAVGAVVESPLELRESYFSARRMLHCSGNENPVVFSTGEAENEEAGFAFSDVKPDIRRAFEELDTVSLHNALSKIADYYEERPGLRIQAMDAACNVLYIAISLLPGGDKTVSDIFADEAEGLPMYLSHPFNGRHRIVDTPSA
ncbi:MAG: hypothetical protein LBB94_07395 [Clostridiales bacterium]|nr:hypothetical protein [Clostridiales bacterium]